MTEGREDGGEERIGEIRVREERHLIDPRTRGARRHRGWGGEGRRAGDLGREKVFSAPRPRREKLAAVLLLNKGNRAAIGRPVIEIRLLRIDWQPCRPYEQRLGCRNTSRYDRKGSRWLQGLFWVRPQLIIIDEKIQIYHPRCFYFFLRCFFSGKM